MAEQTAWPRPRGGQALIAAEIAKIASMNIKPTAHRGTSPSSNRIPFQINIEFETNALRVYINLLTASASLGYLPNIKNITIVTVQYTLWHPV